MTGKLHWEQWGGIVQRGKPDTLVLHRIKAPSIRARHSSQGGLSPRSLASSTTELYTRKSGSKSTGSSSGWSRLMSKSRHTRFLAPRLLFTSLKWNRALKYRRPLRKGYQPTFQSGSPFVAHPSAFSSVWALVARSWPLDCNWFTGPMVNGKILRGLIWATNGLCVCVCLLRLSRHPYPLKSGIWGGESYWNFILEFHFCNHVFSMINIPHHSMSLASRWKLNTCA